MPTELLIVAGAAWLVFGAFCVGVFLAGRRPLARQGRRIVGRLSWRK